MKRTIDNTTTSRPNIILIVADQMTGCILNSTILKAPNIKKLIQQGVVFDSAYTNSPLCGPSRLSFLTGQLPSRIGAYDNASELPSFVPTLGHYMRDLGYRTILSGKMHFVGADQLHGFEERLTTDIYPADFGWTPDWENFQVRPEWYHNMLSVVQSGKCVTTNQLDFDEDVAFHTKKKILEMSRDGDKRPFFMVVSLTHPHDPYAISQKFWDIYQDGEIDMPKIPRIKDEFDDPHSKRLRFVMALDEFLMTDDRIKSARHAYFGAISYVDDKIGSFMEILEQTGFSSNTITLFTSDHGDMLGERGLWYKMNFFEGSARVPLIIHAPRYFSHQRVIDHVSLLDLLPTIIDLAKINDSLSETQYISKIDGESLFHFLKGKKKDIYTRTVLGEYFAEGAISPIFMIRRDRYKFIHSQPDPDQLYDLLTDPNEMNNLANNPQFETLKSSFLREVNEKWNSNELRNSIISDQKSRRFIHKTLNIGKFRPWEFQPSRDATKEYVRSHIPLDDIERMARYPPVTIPPPDGPFAFKFKK